MDKEQLISNLETYLGQSKDYITAYHDWVSGMISRFETEKLTPAEAENARCMNTFWRKTFVEMHVKPSEK